MESSEINYYKLLHLSMSNIYNLFNMGLINYFFFIGILRYKPIQNFMILILVSMHMYIVYAIKVLENWCSNPILFHLIIKIQLLKTLFQKFKLNNLDDVQRRHRRRSNTFNAFFMMHILIQKYTAVLFIIIVWKSHWNYDLVF